jgi:hypothetical protein
VRARLAAWSSSALLLASVACGSGAQPATGASVPDGSSGVDSGDAGSVIDSGTGSNGGAGASDAGAAADTGPPPASCLSDAGLMEAGAWQDITPKVQMLNYSGTNAVVLRPDNPAIVYVGVDTNGIFRSEDCGSTWNLVNTGMNAAAISSGRPWSMVIDPVNPDVMYTVEGYGVSGLFKSTNAGVDWDQILTPNITSVFNAGGQITGVSMDPTDHTHLVVESHQGTGTCDQATTTCLAESTDSGATWKLLTIPTGWAEDSSIVIVDRMTWMYPTLFGGLWRTTDEGKTWTNQSPSGDQGASGNYYEAYMWQGPDGRYYLPSHTQGLLQSAANDTGTWSIVPHTPEGTQLIPTAASLVMSDEFSNSFYVAQQSNPTAWTSFPATPPDTTQTTANDSSFLAYDRVHNILYTSNLNGGLWRTAAP